MLLIRVKHGVSVEVALGVEDFVTIRARKLLQPGQLFPVLKKRVSEEGIL